MVWLMEDKSPTAQLPPEWGGVIPSQVFLEEAQRLVAAAHQRGLPLRVMGGVAIRLHSQEYTDLARRLGRLASGQQEFTDLDFVSYGRYRDQIRACFEELGYRKRRATLSTAASERQIYFHPQGWFFADVFYDRLVVANHPLDFRHRLELDSPTITPTDLLLEKLQIVNISEKDVKDIVVLLAAHALDEGEAADAINPAYLARLLSRSWGFWHTATTNLTGLKKIVSHMAELTAEERSLLHDRLDGLTLAIAEAPKSWRWKLRSVVGPRLRWYEPVETMETVGGFGIWRLYEDAQSPARKEHTADSGAAS